MYASAFSSSNVNINYYMLQCMHVCMCVCMHSIVSVCSICLHSYTELSLVSASVVAQEYTYTHTYTPIYRAWLARFCVSCRTRTYIDTSIHIHRARLARFCFSCRTRTHIHTSIHTHIQSLAGSFLRQSLHMSFPKNSQILVYWCRPVCQSGRPSCATFSHLVPAL
jgi:hypothetical protein